MAKVVWSPQSLQDLEDIAEYIAKDSEYYASLVIENIVESIEILALFPRIGRKVPELQKENVREIFYKRYRIIYQIVDDHVEIITVVHSSRLLSF